MQTDYYEIADPAVEPVMTLPEAKEWLRVDPDITADDVLIQALVDAATDFCETYTNRCFVERTFYGYFANLVLSKYQNYEYPFIQVRRSPFISLSNAYLYVDGDYSELIDSADYEVQQSSSFARVRFLKYLSSDEAAFPIRLEFVAGYGAASDVPEELVTAVRQKLSFLYENRGDVSPDGKKGMPVEVKSMLSRYRIMNTF